MNNWIMLAFISLLLTGIGNFCFKLATNAGQSPLTVVMIVFLVDLTIAAFIWLFLKPPVTPGIGPIGWPIAAGVTAGLGVLFLILAIGKPEAKAGIATAIMNANFALVAVLSWVFCQEALNIKQIAGLLAILGGIALLI